MPTIRRERRSEWLDYLPYWLIIAIVIFTIASALWQINRTPDPTEVHNLPTVHVRNEGRSGKLR